MQKMSKFAVRLLAELYMTSKEIRQKFLDFFAEKGHTVVPSAPMVVKDDPTLMFTNAGMNQFKDIFLGNAKTKFKRAADSQKCLRVSGKHNDLEEVGHDTYHHTMFEMLGNWSFGDYFKTEAIDWAWELLTEVYKIDKNLLYATVFEGSPEDGTEMDMEAKQAWLKHMPEDHIVLIGQGDKSAELEKKYVNNKSVHLVGRVNYNIVYKYYAIADVFVLPTLLDNWSLVIPEAMSCGLPVSTTIYNGCHSELVHEGENGYVFDCFNRCFFNINFIINFKYF